MVVSVAITKAITNLQEANQRLGLHPIADPNFTIGIPQFEKYARSLDAAFERILTKPQLGTPCNEIKAGPGFLTN